MRAEETHKWRTKVSFKNLVSSLGLSLDSLEKNNRFVALSEVRADIQPLVRFQSQRQALVNALKAPGVICGVCRVNRGLDAARAVHTIAPTLEADGSQRLQQAVTAYILGDAMAWDEMASDEALEDTLFQDLIHLARKKAERVQRPVEWEKTTWGRPGEVLATGEMFHVVYDTAWTTGYQAAEYGSRPYSVAWYMNTDGKWGPIGPAPKKVKTGWFSEKEIFKAVWRNEPPQPGLGNILKRAAELLAPAE